MIVFVWLSKGLGLNFKYKLLKHRYHDIVNLQQIMQNRAYNSVFMNIVLI